MNPLSPAALFNLTGKVAVIIGGTGVLCGMMAEGLSAAGATIVLVGRNPDKAAANIAKIEAAGGKASFEACDADDKAQTEALLARVLAKHGQVDILVNGAGMNSPTPIFDLTGEEFDRIMSVNVKGVLFGCQVFGKYFVDTQRPGSIINIGSEAALKPLSRVFTYSASKAAVHNLSMNLAREWAPHGVRVNILVPGFFPAEQNRKILDTTRVDNIMRGTPMKRFGEPQELVGATLLLASDAGKFITGAEIVVDGGFAATRF